MSLTSITHGNVSISKSVPLLYDKTCLPLTVCQCEDDIEASETNSIAIDRIDVVLDNGIDARYLRHGAKATPNKSRWGTSARP